MVIEIKAEKKRIVWIDQLRGLAFYFVVLGHMIVPENLEIWIYSFHMPLFFIISGFNLNVDKMYKTDFKVYISHLAKRMLVPYLWLQLLALGLKYLFYLLIHGREIRISAYLSGIFVGNSFIISSPSNPMYFVLLLFISQLMLWCIIKLSKGNKWITFAAVALSTLASVFTEGKGMPWHINVMPTAMLFIFIGRFLMDGYLSVHKKLRRLKRPYYIFVCIVMLALGCVAASFNGRASIHGNIFGENYLLFVLGAVATSVAFMLLVMLIPSVKVFKLIGMNTIFLLGIHEPFLLVVEGLFPELWTKGWFVAVASIVCYFLPVPVLYLVEKTMPYICGNVTKESNVIIKIFKFVAVALAFATPYASFTRTFLDGALRMTQAGRIASAVIFAVIVAVLTLLFNRLPSVFFLEGKKEDASAEERKPVIFEDEGIMIIIPVEEV